MGDSYPSILCADDDPEVLERMKEFFTLRGFIVLTATNGVEACLQVKRWAPKAVVLDLLIPRLGGIGTLGRIRAFDPGIAVIIVSDTADALHVVTEAGLSVTGAFAKPLDLDRISEALARVGVAAPAPLEPAGSRGSAPEPRARIMLIDDERQFREMLAEYLAGKGFEVSEAESGEEALARIPAVAPDLVLLDLMMSGIGGLETLRRIKLIRPEMRVVMVTAIDDLDVARSALNAGAADYVTKPFSFQYLDAVLEIHVPAEPAAPDHGIGISRAGTLDTDA
ncbi:MAG TPA: response regulator [Candidatus Methylomirabilis sp.]|nr:response regulator [Candidatus Methylomirabilis sp.]